MKDLDAGVAREEVHQKEAAADERGLEEKLGESIVEGVDVLKAA